MMSSLCPSQKFAVSVQELRNKAQVADVGHGLGLGLGTGLPKTRIMIMCQGSVCCFCKRV